LAVADRDTYLLNHTVQRAQWENDKNADEAAKKFVLSKYEPVYFQSLSHPLIKMKMVTLWTILDFLKAKYPAEPEEVALQKEELRAKWDPNNHIKNLFQSVKEGCETLVAMKSIVLLEMDKTFCEYTYNAIKNSGQFESACIKWKALDTANQLLPVPVPATALAMREFFTKKYDVFDANNDSLREAGIANNVQLQALVQATNDQVAQLRSENLATRAAQSTVLQILKEKTIVVECRRLNNMHMIWTVQLHPLRYVKYEMNPYGAVTYRYFDHTYIWVNDIKTELKQIIS
jgi:hypothetical protein